MQFTKHFLTGVSLLQEQCGRRVHTETQNHHRVCHSRLAEGFDNALLTPPPMRFLWERTPVVSQSPGECSPPACPTAVDGGALP